MTDLPVTPDSQQARDWVISELAKPEYQSAKPTWFDLLASAVRDWFASLNFGSVSGPSGLGMLVVIVAVVAAMVIGFLIFGRPRMNQRRTVHPSLFGDAEGRSALAMRQAAESASQRGDFAGAITELFRAIAQSCAERGILSITPGTTAHDFGVRAGHAFPQHAEAITAAAAAFDDVRYLGRSGAGEQYRLMVTLERQLRTLRPELARA